LRAGYEGKEAAELTRASMMLSTLGMIEATQATTYLISTLKGWKISASEVIGVVDRLAAVDMAAAVSAGDLALAMSRANNSARLAGSDMNQFIGYVTTVADVTQKSAESVGESFKTIYSRFGNVKANKFAATYEDQNSEGYNSEEFENLNDIETVLDRVGIKLRENASTWRDIDTVLEDIAENWKTWDRTTQNAVATAVAGTRQRENVITLFENWDDVAKYAEIAENAYGTATEKMEAYTDSIEASKQRMTTAVEEWSLKLNQSDAIKAFYDQLAFLIKNIHAVALSIAGIGITTNFNKVTTSLFSGLTSLSNKLINIGNMWGGNWRVSGIKNTRESTKYGLKGAVKNMKD
jgi:TP901 family phage tail tape measure protein